MESLLPELQKTSREAAKLRRTPHSRRAKVLTDLAGLLTENTALILAENRKDLDRMGREDPKYDRLLLNEDRVRSLAGSLREVSRLEDPAGKVLLEKTLPNGIRLKKVTTPMGVVGTIFESRPNVTIDVAALCLLSGNAAVLKGGKEADYSNRVFVQLIHQALRQNGLPEEVVLLLPTDRKFMTELLQADRYVDLIIPRGSQGLINFVRENSRIPTIETGAGVCHVYVDKTADTGMAAEIIVNAKASRPSVCNSLDCMILDAAIAGELIPKLKAGFEKYAIEVFADEAALPYFEQEGFRVNRAGEEDFGKEWLDFKVSVKTVNSPDEALDHIREYSSRHSEAIVTRDQALAERFLDEVDAAAVYHNASTRFTDGGEFGLGAEIGISTQKLHARGPFALEKLVTEKWVAVGEGQVRW
ncbi:glutamate-5-semialdehyde dehydrogenase [Leadbetterella sp. DM7]|uniref:glutamate-5-semialdehyde dehydrogenase n=1 Tax=Leadbetterella sp. DM7 TaxID=3235085 RepID=UPI00349EA02D